ncbi:MAG: helix-turn-helix transcriptional regulator [Saprospiraceae bacterium]|jgi:putative transcriptional regulator|nr:helix-turn-helix transcriptional regulator [Saprospiraceae bacterium]
MKNSVRIERAILQITQEELAKKVGVTRQTIHALENGKYVPSTVLALKIASVCGKTLDEIFQLEPNDWAD